MSLPTERTEHFVLKEDGIYHVTMPPEDACYTDAMSGPGSYEYAVQSAISNAVEVSNQEEVINQIGEKHALFSSMRNGWSIEKGKIYSLQCSVEIQNKTIGSWTYEVALVTFSQPGSEADASAESQEELYDCLMDIYYTYGQNNSSRKKILNEFIITRKTP